MRPRPVLAASAVVAALATPALAQDGADPTCPDPTPVAVEVTVVPIVVASTTDDYFVLYVRHDVNGTTIELPVSVTRGAAGTTTLSENIEALPAARYRVEKYRVDTPADVDGDCIDDLTELADPKGNPVNPVQALALSDGAVLIPDRAAFEAVASGHFLKFLVVDLHTETPGVYFPNTNKYLTHEDFLEALGLNWSRGMLTGYINYHPHLRASDGSAGVYVLRFITFPFSMAAHVYTLLAASMPLLDNDLGLFIADALLPGIQSDLLLDWASRIFLVLQKDITPEVSFQALNPGVGMGRLRALDADERPHPRDIVLYEALPNELPRVAGIISTVPQTPLSHVNLRAVQNRIPNAFIRDADNATITALLDSYVRYEVTETGYTLDAATKAEVDEHYESARPAQAQTPERDLSVTTITPLSQVGFEDWKAFGVKAANVAVLGTLGFPAGDGTHRLRHPVPFLRPVHARDRPGARDRLRERERPRRGKTHARGRHDAGCGRPGDAGPPGLPDGLRRPGRNAR